MEVSLEQETVALFRADPERLACLQAVRQLRLPDWYIVAGFVRNAIWDHIACKGARSEMADVDVAFFDRNDTSLEAEQVIAQRLSESLPNIKWDVKNQARMHLRNGHRQYQSTLDAVTCYPELQTCVGVRLEHDGRIAVAAPYGIARNWDGTVTINPKAGYPPAIAAQRVAWKRWLQIWPALRLDGFELNLAIHTNGVS